MRILYQPQLSMRSYTAVPKWLLASDAHLTKFKAYVRALPDDWQWHVLLPPVSQCAGSPAGVGGDRVREVVVPHMENVHQQRFNFPMGALVDVYRDVQPDLLICEIPEQVVGWRVVQSVVGGSCPIITLIEHVEFYAETSQAAAGSSSFLRQLEGAQAADVTVFALDGMRSDWCRHAALVAPEIAAGVSERCRVWPGLISPVEVDGARPKGDELRDDDALPVVFLISRLSDPSRTRYEQIIAASNHLLQAGWGHRLWVANPNDGRDWDWIAAQADAFEEHPFGRRRLERAEYLRLLWAADVVPVMYDLSRIYSVGACEAALAGCTVIGATQRYPGPISRTCEPEPEAIATALSEAFTELSLMAVDDREAVLAAQGVEQNLGVVRETIDEVLACA